MDAGVKRCVAGSASARFVSSGAMAEKFWQAKAQPSPQAAAFTGQRSNLQTLGSP